MTQPKIRMLLLCLVLFMVSVANKPFMLSVIMLNAVILSVMAPLNEHVEWKMVEQNKLKYYTMNKKEIAQKMSWKIWNIPVCFPDPSVVKLFL